MDGFSEFFEDQYGSVLRTVGLIVGDRARAEDATQEAFTRAFRKWRSVRAMKNPRAWILVVAVNIDRRRWRRSVESVIPDHEPVSVDDPATSVTTVVAVRDALDCLTIRQRAAVVLRYLTDLPIADIAAALGCVEGTVRATLHQALAKMRIELTEDTL